MPHGPLSKALNILPASYLSSRGCLSCTHHLLPSLSLSFSDSTEQSLTTSGTGFLGSVQPGERNRFQTPTLVLKQEQFSPQAPCPAEDRTNCFKHRAREAGRVGFWVTVLHSVFQSHHKPRPHYMGVPDLTFQNVPELAE